MIIKDSNGEHNIKGADKMKFWETHVLLYNKEGYNIAGFKLNQIKEIILGEEELDNKGGKK